MLPDGTYEAFVIDASVADESAAPDQRSVTLELAVVAGEHKGEVVSLTATGWAANEVELLAMPATLTVEAGTPSVRIDW